ncbi:MAG: hypothetical protein HYU64_09925 [Armatimonadetes bacterium]|nr:hypothetical protein [Armatimonadota bacterium]
MDRIGKIMTPGAAASIYSPSPARIPVQMDLFETTLIQGESNTIPRSSLHNPIADEEYVMPSPAKLFDALRGGNPRGNTTVDNLYDSVALPAGAGSPRKWTILFYLDGNNSLEPAQVKSLLDLEKVGSTKDINVVAQLFRAPQSLIEDEWKKAGFTYTPENIDGDWNGARLYYVTRSPDSRTIRSRVLADFGTLNAADPSHLSQFLTWGIKNFPAQHYMVILANHGGGFMGALHDDQHKEVMKPPELKKALEDVRRDTGADIDILGFDACLMAQAEVAHQMKDQAKIMLASEDQEGYTYVHWPLSETLEELAGRSGNMGPYELATRFVEGSKSRPLLTPSLSAFDLSKFDGLPRALDGFSKALLETDTDPSVIRENIGATQGFVLQGDRTPPFTDFRDLFDFASHIKNDPRVSDSQLKSRADILIRQIKNCIIAEQHIGYGLDNAHGLSIYMPTDRESLESKKFKYDQTLLAKDTLWNEALKKFAS